MIKDNITQNIEYEISSLDLREDNRKYIKGFVQLNDNSVVDAIFVYTENFYEDIKGRKLDDYERFNDMILCVNTYLEKIRNNCNIFLNKKSRQGLLSVPCRD